ncbi:hypothetical protein D3C83_238360 [compost metagenome]
MLNEVPPRVSSVAQQPVPEALDMLIAACLEKNREDRPKTIDEFRDVLDGLAVRQRWTQLEAQAAWEAHQRARRGVA